MLLVASRTTPRVLPYSSDDACFTLKMCTVQPPASLASRIEPTAGPWPSCGPLLSRNACSAANSVHRGHRNVARSACPSATPLHFCRPLGDEALGGPLPPPLRFRASTPACEHAGAGSAAYLCVCVCEHSCASCGAYQSSLHPSNTQELWIKGRENCGVSAQPGSGKR